MKIKWLGHAAFLITSKTGTRIITDPYAPGDDLCYGEINQSADIVTVSHLHHDHNNTATVGGSPAVVRSTSIVKDIQFTGVATYHDDALGQDRGDNTVFCFTIDGVRICHLGDLGHPLDERQRAEIGNIDVLLIPVGGRFTIDPGTATRVVTQLKPRAVIPMHFANNKCKFLTSGVDDFLRGKKNVKQLNSSEVKFGAYELPAETQFVKLQPEL